MAGNYHITFTTVYRTMSRNDTSRLSLLDPLNVEGDSPAPSINQPATGPSRSSEMSASELETSEFSEVHPKPVRTVGLFPTVMGLLNSLLGAGILSVPNSFTSEGVIPSFILLLLMWGLSYIAGMIIISLRDKTDASGLPDLALKTLGKGGEIALAVLSLLFIAAAQVSYLILGGDMLASFFALGGVDTTSVGARALMMFVYALVFPIALTFPRDVRFLSYVGTVSVVCIILFDFAIMIKAFIQFGKTGPAEVIVARVDINMFSALSIYALTFALPVICLPALATYTTEIHARYRAALWAMILCLGLVVIPGIFGYLQFGANTKPNIMQNYSDGDGVMFVVRIAFFLIVSFAYPAISQAPMTSWGNLVFKDGVVKAMPWKKRAAVIAMTHALPLTIAMFLANVKPALSIGGALGGCIVDFVMPSLMWITYNKELVWYHPKKLLLWLFAAFGAVAAVIATYTAVVDAIKTFGA